MYREPTESSKVNVLKDPSGTARSAIRRQASVRGPSARYGRPSVHGTSRRTPFPPIVTDEIWRVANADIARRTHSPNSNPGRGVGTNVADPEHEAGQRILRDAMSHHHPGRRLRIPRESSMNDIGDRQLSGDNRGSQTNSDAPPFTSRFAPAAAYHNRGPSQPPPVDVVHLSPFPRLDGSGDDPASSVPLLRRVGQRSVNEASRANRGSGVDGLGDRQRSPSPDDELGDAWDTLLTTIAPDLNAPSAASSFNSSISAANTRTGASQNAQNDPPPMPPSLDASAGTMHAVLDPYPEYLNPCDYPTSEDSETEPDVVSLGRSRMPRPSAGRHSPGINSTMSSHPPIPTASLPGPQPPPYPDFRPHLRNIMDRIARRERVPDDLWAAAGLAQVIGHGIGMGDDPLDHDNDGPVRQRL